MKTKFFLIAVFIVSVLFIILSCGKEDPVVVTEPDPIIPPVLQCNVQVGGDTIIQGGNVIFTWTSNADSLILNINPGSTHSLDTCGSETFVVLETSSFIFTFFKDDSSSVKSFTIVTIIPGDPNDPPSLYAKALPNTIEYGDSTTIKVAKLGNGIIDSIHSDLPGFTGEYGEFLTPSLMESITYHFIAYGPGGQCNVDVMVTVIPLPTNTELLCINPSLVVDSVWDENGYVHPMNATFYSQTLSFFPDGTLKQYRLPDYQLIHDTFWYFANQEETRIYWPFEEKHIIELTPYVFIYEFELIQVMDTAFLKIKYVPDPNF